MNKQTSNKKMDIKATSIRIGADINAAVAHLMTRDRRPSMANTMEWLLATHPLVQKILKKEAATAGN